MKNKNGIKKPLSSYQLYVQLIRPVVKEQFPGMDNKTMLTKSAEMWKSLTEVDKEPYVEKAKILKEEHAALLAEAALTSSSSSSASSSKESDEE